MLILHVIALFALPVVMGRSAKTIGASMKGLAQSRGVSAFAISFVVLGFATSLPEIFVAAFSAARGTPDLSLGNLLGANIVILSLLVGLTAVLAGKISPPGLYRKNVLAFFVAVIGLPALSVLDGRVTRMEGAAMIILHALFLAYFARTQPKIEQHPDGRGLSRMWRGAAAGGILLGSSYLLVNSALTVAETVGIPPLVIGLLMLSLGTNLPELTFVLTTAAGPKKDIVIGDLFGSVLVNTPTLGLLAVLSPFQIARPVQAGVAAAFLLILLVLFAVLIVTGRALTRREGFVLIVFYAVFLFNQFKFGS